jgi:hypothetical protein
MVALKSNHINGIELLWSYTKRRLGKFHGVGKQTYHLHLKECQWRFNLRNEDLYNSERVKRVTLKKIEPLNELWKFISYFSNMSRGSNNCYNLR